jgi:hypothetical protein
VAEDLTQRPPGGLPPPTEPAAASEPQADAPAAPARRPAQERPFRYRFGLAYLVLAVVAGLGVGSAYLMWEREPAQETRWASWQPTGDENSYHAQIAEYVGRRHRNTSGNQLVAVIASTPQIQTQQGVVPVEWVAFQKETRGGDRDFDVAQLGDSVMYTLCGGGEQCSIAEGEPSGQRLNLLRREALELSLYSFKHLDGLDSVVVLMPPNLGDPNNPEDDTQTAVFFQQGELRRELERPLAQTLAVGRATRVRELNPIEQITVDRLTRTRLFLYDFQIAPSGAWGMVLAPALRAS